MMKRNEPAKLYKCNADDVLEQQLSISGRLLFILALLVILFFIFCLICYPQTYGFINW